MAYELRIDNEMATKKHKAEEIVTKLRHDHAPNAQKKSMAEAIRSLGGGCQGRQHHAEQSVGKRLLRELQLEIP